MAPIIRCNNMPLDCQIQIDTIVDDCIERLIDRFSEKHPLITPADLFLKMKAYVPTIDIVVKESNECCSAEVIEKATFGSPQSEAQEFFGQSDISYDTGLELQSELRRKKFQRFIFDRIENLVISDPKLKITEAMLKSDLELRNIAVSRKFLEWISDKETDNLGVMLSEMSKSDPDYTHLLSKIPESPLKDHMKSTLLRAFQIRFRAAVVRGFTDENYTRFLGCFDTHQEIKARLYSIFIWNQLYRSSWEETFLLPKIPELLEKPELYKRLKGNERILVSEIVPRFLDDFSSEVGGTTIKISDYNDLNQEFIVTEGFKVLGKMGNPGYMKELRHHFLRTIIARRYIFSDAIDQIMHYTAVETGMPDAIKRLGVDPEFREMRYKLFYRSSKDFMARIYEYIHSVSEKGPVPQRPEGQQSTQYDFDEL